MEVLSEPQKPANLQAPLKKSDSLSPSEKGNFFGDEILKRSDASVRRFRIADFSFKSAI